MADYKQMYIHLFQATEQAIDLLIAAQRTCEEMYSRENPVPLLLTDPSPDKRPAKGGILPPTGEEPE